MTTEELRKTEEFKILGRLVMSADCVIVPALVGRGVDSHGHPISGLAESTMQALKDIAAAGELAQKLLTNFYGPQGVDNGHSGPGSNPS